MTPNDLEPPAPNKESKKTKRQNKTKENKQTKTNHKTKQNKKKHQQKKRKKQNKEGTCTEVYWQNIKSMYNEFSEICATIWSYINAREERKYLNSKFLKNRIFGGVVVGS